MITNKKLKSKTMSNKNQFLDDIIAKNREGIFWPEGEAISLNEEAAAPDEGQELVGINQDAMADALQQIAKGEENSFSLREVDQSAVNDEEPLSRLAGELKEERAEQDKEERAIFQTEIVGAVSPLADFQREAEEKEEEREETVTLPKQKVIFIQKLINNIKENTRRLEELLSGNWEEENGAIGIEQFAAPPDEETTNEQSGEKVIEGVFNGQHMIGPDGKQYNMPPNYASKSKLVEGDILKLVIGQNGKFIYKQIGPIERERIIGLLALGKNGDYFVEQGSRRWRILTASVTYFKGQTGDEAIILVPKYGESNWAAVENIITRNM